MQIVSVSSPFADIGQACDDIFHKLAQATHGHDSPDVIFLFGRPELIQEEMRDRAARAFPSACLHASSSSHGVISTDWTPSANVPTCGALAICDPGGAYGTASAQFEGDDADIAAETVREALVKAERVGEAPDLVLLSSAPGHEEAVLRGVRSVVGRGTQILGASSADNDGSGRWRQMSANRSHQDGVVITVLFPSRPITVSQDCGHELTPSNGLVTAAEGRVLKTIDGEPAAKVYSRWAGLLLQMEQLERYVPITLDRKIASPFGRIVGHEAGVPQIELLQPSRVQADGSLVLMAEAHEGERLWCATGERDRLLARMPLLFELAQAGDDAAPSGGLLVRSASLDLQGDRMIESVALHMKSCLGDLPGLVVFSFGEQWTRKNGEFAHANQMMLCAMFR